MSAEFPTLAEIVDQVIADAIADCAQLREGIGGPATAEIITRYAESARDAWEEARIIYTVADLDALPDRSIVYEKHRDVAWMKDSRNNADEPWWCTGSEVEEPASAIVLPALLIRHPSWGQS